MTESSEKKAAMHTAGPWQIVRAHGVPIGVGLRVNSAGKECNVFTLFGNTMDKSDDEPDLATLEANAALISAAPDLLAACKLLRTRLESFVGAVADITDCRFDVDALKLADAAIAKAGG